MERHFPEKLTSEQAKAYFNEKVEALNSSMNFFNSRLEVLEKKIIEAKSEIETIKMQSAIKSRVSVATPSNMTPFATRFQPAGGNESPR